MSTDNSQPKDQNTNKNNESGELINSIIDTLYDNFILRDLFAKIVPGIIVLFSALYNFDNHSMDKELIERTVAIGWSATLILAGLAWIVGISVQSFGTTFKLIKMHPKKYDDIKRVMLTKRFVIRRLFKKNKAISTIRYIIRRQFMKSKVINTQRYVIRHLFKKIAEPFDIKQEERFAVIKEASGNGATAISIGIIIIEIRSHHFFQLDLIWIAQHYLQLSLFVVIALSLFKANRDHAEKQYKYIETCTKKCVP